MGSLHSGHLSLIELAARSADLVAVSIYVNPTQFAANEDFDAYPRDVAGDRMKLTAAGVAALFEPTRLYAAPTEANKAAVAPSGDAAAADDGGMPAPEAGLVVGAATPARRQAHDCYVVPEGLQRPLCGASRPHFFRGVATIVAKLFNIVEPDIAVFGRKDYQQLQVLRAMVRDLDFPVTILAGDTVREGDGVAASSRNARLTPEARRAAPALHRELAAAAEDVARGERSGTTIALSMAERLEGTGARVDYCEVVDGESLEKVDDLDHVSVAVLAVAAWLPAADGQEVRLIDNMQLKPVISV